MQSEKETEKAINVTDEYERMKKGTVGFFRVSNSIRDGALAELKGRALSVLLCLASHAGQDGKAWPGVRTIEQETGYASEAVARAIRKLERLGYIRVERMKGRSSYYTITTDMIIRNSSNSTCSKIEQVGKVSASKIEQGCSKIEQVSASKIEHEEEPSFNKNKKEEPNNNTIQQATDEFMATYPIDGMVVDDVFFSLSVYLLKLMGISEREINQFDKEYAVTGFTSALRTGSMNVLYTFEKYSKGSIKYPLKYLKSTWKKDIRISDEAEAALWRIRSAAEGSGDYSSDWEIPAEEGEE
jgi:DNA-binding MarR family transcriptional regulator